MGRLSWQHRALLAVIGLFACSIAAGTLFLSAQWLRKPFPGFFIHENLTVGPYSLPHWNGAKSGLQILDRVETVEGMPLRSRADLYALVKQYPSGSKFHYEVVRGLETIRVVVPSMVFSFHDWLLTFGVYLITGIGFLGMGVTPFYFRASSPAVGPLLFLATTVFVWFSATFDFMTTGWLPKEVRTFAFTLAPSAGIHLGLLLKTGKPLRRNHPAYLFLIYGIAGILGALYALTFFGARETWIRVLQASYGYSCAAALLFLALLWSALRGPLSDLERSRLRVISVGAGLGFLLPTLETVLTSSFHWSIPYNVALLPTLFFPLSVAYALVKYRLFDLGRTLKIGLSRIALTALLLMIYVGVVFVLDASVGIYDQGLLIPVLFSILVVLIFNPLLRCVEEAVDRYIYRQEYDPIRLQKEVSSYLRSLAKTQALADGFLKLVCARTGIERACLFYRLEDGRAHLTGSLDETDTEFQAMPDTLSLLLECPVESRQQGISRGEADAHPAFREMRRLLLDVFDRLRAELFMPIVFQGEVRGFIAFGVKRSEREYSADDFKLLGLLTDQLALSLENSRLYEASERAKEEYRLLYDQSAALNKRLIETDRLKKQFVANISHELRTPISTILGYTEVLLDADFRGDSRPILERLAENGQDLCRMMGNLFDFSRVEAGATLTKWERVQVKEVLESLEVMIRKLIRGKPIQFRVQVDSAIDYIESDAQKLQQILIQLLTNALKFTEKGEIAVMIRTVSGEDGSFVEISVCDTGIGIGAEDQELIFEEFRQLDGSSTRQYGGTGVGLSLCRKLAQSLGGKIQVTSQVGLGSVFSLLLPTKAGRAQAAGLS